MNGHDPSIADLLRSTIQDAQELVRSELALVRAEMKQEARRVGTGAAMLAAGAVAALIGVVFLLIAVAWGIVEALGWPSWSGFAIVGALVTVIALVLALGGRRQLSGSRHMPQTIDTMKENLQWMRARTS